jgi:5'-3' exonuclease
MTRDIRHEFQRQLWDMGIAYVKALGEADTVLVDMIAAGKLDVVASTDMDYLLSPIPRLWIPNRATGGALPFEEIVLEEVLKGEGITPEALRDAGILCGVEPLRGKVHVHTHTAFTWIRYYKGLEPLLASAVKERQLDALRPAGVLEAVRAHFQPQTPWTVRVRPDHYERFKDFLEAL